MEYVMIIRQMSVGSIELFTYIVGCERTRDAVVIDPGKEVDRIIAQAKEDGLAIKYIFNTHHHWDHIEGNVVLKRMTGAKIVMHAMEDDIIRGDAKADIRLTDEKTFSVGDIDFTIIFTPGHTIAGLTLYVDGNLFTGDTLFVGDSGRTDLSGGNRPALGASIRKLMAFPDDTIIWPGHDLGATPASTIYREKRTNVNAREYGYYVAD
jgi:hydroxyacylglutathione hydrolase